MVGTNAFFLLLEVMCFVRSLPERGDRAVPLYILYSVHNTPYSHGTCFFVVKREEEEAATLSPAAKIYQV